ncbi:hypothetical protein [Methylobacterium sp. WL116]|uniref:hypothetical protein n=1 Tax=Methylobacterium sp. WL116 TaxID=2603889 RepID=UPI0011CBEE21|nr:hypothetical protein [Methylobacterium sp. WL116]TXM93101.1 hypothetical protein FV223_09545 [Methylobacterium sp. WL116]
MREKDRQSRDAIARTVFANLAYAVALGLEPPTVGVSLRAAKQKHTRYDRKGFGNMPSVVELLASYGDSVLSLHRSSRKGTSSSITISENWASTLRKTKIGLHHFSQEPGRETIYLGKVERDFAGREESRELIDYADTDETHRYRSEMKAINAFLASSDISLEDHEGKPCPTSFPFLRRHFNVQPDDPEGTERFDLGGRLFGGWWQTLAKDQRHRIRIKGEPVADLDFDAMFVRLAYLRANLTPPPGDLYAGLPGLPGAPWRAGVKKAVLAMLFRRTPLTRVPRGTSGELPPGTSGPQLQAAIVAAHPALAPIFETGIGLSLMFTESQVIVKALLDLADQKITALPMHDGLMVARSKADKVARIMSDAAETVAGHRLPISLKSLY